MTYYPGQSKTSRHVAFGVMLVIGITLTVALFYVKTRAQSAKAEASRLEGLVASEKAALNVLKAEIAYLESPDRVSRLARRELGLQPMSAAQIIRPEDIAARFPLRDEREPAGEPNE